MKGLYSLKVLTALALAILIPLTARAQLVADGQTNVISGVTNVLAAPVFVGSNGSFTSLSLINGGMVAGTSATIGSLSNHAAGNLLHISHWEGTPVTGGGTDELLITTTNSVTAAFLADVQFDGYAPGALLLGTGELVPVGVPEPTTLAIGVAAVFALFVCRKHFHHATR